MSFYRLLFVLSFITLTTMFTMFSQAQEVRNPEGLSELDLQLTCFIKENPSPIVLGEAGTETDYKNINRVQLVWASNIGDVDEVQLLLNEVDMNNNWHKHVLQRAFRRAVVCDHVEIAQLFLNRGVYTNRFVLLSAISSRMQDILLEARSELTGEDYEDWYDWRSRITPHGFNKAKCSKFVPRRVQRGSGSDILERRTDNRENYCVF